MHVVKEVIQLARLFYLLVTSFNNFFAADCDIIFLCYFVSSIHLFLPAVYINICCIYINSKVNFCKSALGLPENNRNLCEYTFVH